MKNIKLATTLIVFIVAIGLIVGVSGCGQNTKSNAVTPDTTKSDATTPDATPVTTSGDKTTDATASDDNCDMQLRKIGFATRMVADQFDGKFTTKKLAAELSAGSGYDHSKGIMPQCPSGTPYFICNPTNYDESKADMIFAFCAKHCNVVNSQGEVTHYDKSQFESLIATNLFNTNDVSADLCKAVAAATVVTPEDTTSLDSDPTGTWTAGDKNSVYNRLTVRSSGRFKFETVDFTGDVKGGYSGTWQMDGNSVRFQWGSGGADRGSCSGRKTGADSLVFGATTFSR